MKKIIIVDDHKDILTLIKTIISEKYDVIEARNGLEALDLIENNDLNMIITDIDMPFMSGLELIKHIRKVNKNLKIPIIAMSARHDNSIKNLIYENGANYILKKPFSIKELIFLIDRLN